MTSYSFAFLADTQPNRDDKNNGIPQKLSDVNWLVNHLYGSKWPQNTSLSGSNFSLKSIFLGGDLCQCGGDYNGGEQAKAFFGWPAPKFIGGWELQLIRFLYNAGGPVSDQFYPLTPTTLPACYFGLGNHDIQSDYAPAVMWTYGGYWGFRSSSSDFWRYQMWNFIAQMHAGYDVLGARIPPRFGVTRIDATLGFFGDWRSCSYNYWVDVGPADIFQLHRYTGDSEFGRMSNSDWLKRQLSYRGRKRPIIVIQHYALDAETSPGLNKNQIADILSLFSEYNVIAFLYGHIHNKATRASYDLKYGSKTFSGFRPGAALSGYFGVGNVSDTHFDFICGDSSDKNNPFSSNLVYSRDISRSPRPPLSDGNYLVSSVQSGNVFDVQGGVTDPSNGTRVIGFQKGENKSNQTWRLTYQGDEAYRLEPLCVSPTHPEGMSLDSPNYSTSDGEKLQVWRNFDQNNQRWVLIPRDTDIYSIHPAYDRNMCVSMDQGGDHEVKLSSSFNGSDNQKFRFIH